MTPLWALLYTRVPGSYIVPFVRTPLPRSALSEALVAHSLRASLFARLRLIFGKTSEHQKNGQSRQYSRGRRDGQQQE